MTTKSPDPNSGAGRTEPSAAPTVPSPASAAASKPPATPPAPIWDSKLAENFIETELKHAAAGLRNTQIVGAAILLLAGGYLLYVTNHFAESLRPNTASEIAEGMINQQLEQKLPELTDQIKTRIPEYIAQTPDYVLEQLPKYRQTAEDRVEAEMSKYCESTAKQLGTHLDTYLDQHKDEMKGLLQSANDPATLKTVGNSLNQEILGYLRERPQSGEALGSQIDKALAALIEVQKKMHRLATAKDLNAQEKQTRHAIAILTMSIDKPGVIPKLPEKMLPQSSAN